MSIALSAQDISRAITRISHEILERNPDTQSITLLGIPTRGSDLAKRIAVEMHTISGHSIECGTLDITLHRDDLRM